MAKFLIYYYMQSINTQRIESYIFPNKKWDSLETLQNNYILQIPVHILYELFSLSVLIFLETIIGYPFLKEMFKNIWISRWKWDVLFSPPFHSQSETYGMFYLQATKTNQTGNSVLGRIYSSCGSRVELCAQTSKPITFSPQSSRLIAASVTSVIASSLSRVIRAGCISSLDVHYSLVFFYFLEMCCLIWLFPVALSALCLCGFSDEVPYHFLWLNWFVSLQVLCSLGCLSPRIVAINRAVKWQCLATTPRASIHLKQNKMVLKVLK